MKWEEIKPFAKNEFGKPTCDEGGIINFCFEIAHNKRTRPPYEERKILVIGSKSTSVIL